MTLHFKVHFHPICRALQFVIIFLKEVLTGEQDLVKCAKKAYEGSLKKYHGWIVQGIFSVSIFYINLLLTISQNKVSSFVQCKGLPGIFLKEKGKSLVLNILL